MDYQRLRGILNQSQLSCRTIFIFACLGFLLEDVPVEAGPVQDENRESLQHCSAIGNRLNEKLDSRVLIYYRLSFNFNTMSQESRGQRPTYKRFTAPLGSGPTHIRLPKWKMKIFENEQCSAVLWLLDLVGVITSDAENQHLFAFGLLRTTNPTPVRWWFPFYGLLSQIIALQFWDEKNDLNEGLAMSPWLKDHLLHATETEIWNTSLALCTDGHFVRKQQILHARALYSTFKLVSQGQ